MDRGKGRAADEQASGIKGHIAVETLGLPHARAGVAGSQGALLTGKAILADGVSVVGQAFAGALKDLIGTNVQIAQRSQLHALAVMLGRRGIERASAWKREMPPSPEKSRTCSLIA